MGWCELVLFGGIGIVVVDVFEWIGIVVVWVVRGGMFVGGVL